MKIPAAATAALIATTALATPERMSLTLVGDTQGEEGDILSFSVFADQPGSEPLSYAWDLGDGTPQVSGVEETAVAHRYRDDGTYTVRVSASGGTAALETSVEIVVEPVAPRIHVLSDEGEDLTIRLEAEATDPGDDELTYIWDFGDGSPPRQGVDLEEVTHQYAQPGEYTVTLTVVDEDGLEAVRVLGVGANPGFLGMMGGEVPRFQFAGESGKASLMNALAPSRALGGIPIFTGSAPMGGGVADLSDAMAVCLVNAGFWDDENKAHVNFQLTLPSDSAYEPRRYLNGWEHPEGTLAPGQLLVNALVLGIDPSYEDTKDGAENMEIVEGGGGIGAIAGMLRGALGGLLGGGGQVQVGPGRNWQLTATAAALNIEKITHDRIHGHLQAYFEGAWMEAGQSGTVTYAELEGDFAWEMDEVAQANMRRCADRKFAIDTHTPWVEAENVDFEEPRVSLSLTLPYRRETVTNETFEVGWLDPQDGVHRIEGRVVHDDDEVTIHFDPDERLEDAVFYKVRVRGGQTGIRSQSDETLPEDYEWRFSTIPDLVLDLSGGAAGAEDADALEPGEGTSVPWGEGGAVASLDLVPAIGRTAGPARPQPVFSPLATGVEPPQLVQKLCDRTDEDEWTEKPTIDVLVYQSACNQKLIPGKRALVRVYLNWNYPDGKKGVDKYTAEVRLETPGGTLSQTKTFKQQVLYTDPERRSAKNSANFRWKPAAGSTQTVKAVVKGRASGSSDPPKDLAHQPRALETMSKSVQFEFPVVFAQVGSWRVEGVPAQVIDHWTSTEGSIQDGVAFANQNFPVRRIAAKVHRKPVSFESEPGIGDHSSRLCGPDEKYTCMSYVIEDELVDADDWLEGALISHFTKTAGSRPHLIMAVVPEDYGGTWRGITKHHVGLLDDLDFTDPVKDRTPAIILIKSDANTRTVAHELGHYLGLYHDESIFKTEFADQGAVGTRDPGIEGFRLEKSGDTNKSYTEGNSGASQLMSLMSEGDDGKTEDNNFILNEQYEDLLEDLEEESLWVEAVRPVFLLPGSLNTPVGKGAGGAPPSYLAHAPRGASRPPGAFLDPLLHATRGPWAPGSSQPDTRRPAYGGTDDQSAGSLLLTGYVHPSGSFGHLDPVVTLTDAAGSLPDPGDYRARLVAPGGTLLREVPFAVDRRYAAGGEVRQRTLYPFSVAVPHVESLGSVQIVDLSGAVVAERSAGPGAPEVRFIEEGGRVWESGGPIRWEGSDPDGDDLFFSLSYRPDPESEWRPVISDQRVSEVVPAADWLPPGSDPRLRLTASDGVHSTTVVTDQLRPQLSVVDRFPTPARPTAITSRVAVRFNAAVTETSSAGLLSLLGPDGPVEGSFLQDADDGLIFAPADDLRPGTTYTVDLGEVEDRFGSSAPAESWTFSTEVDEEPPTVVRTTPRGGAISIPREAWFMVEFSEPMDSLSLGAGISIRGPDGQAVSTDFRYAPAQHAAILTLPEPLEPATTYQLVVSTAALDFSGNALEPETVVTFTTAGEGGPLRQPGGG